MCGIAAVVGRSDASAAVRAMLQAVRHRGEQDDPILALPGGVALGARRLPIVDPEHGAQPQLSADGRVCVVMNGQIYNHDELREELQRQGLRFATRSDVEVAATALQTWGASAFQRFEGMFALFALDLGTGDWMAARDPFGTKPLYVIEHEAAGEWLFCSEIRPLLAQAATLPVLTLPPGRILTRQGCFRYRARWMRLAADGVSLEAALRQAVQTRIPPDEGCAVLFSAGLDSTLVLHHARELRPHTPAYVLGGSDSPDLPRALEFAEVTGANLRLVPLDATGAATGEAIAALVEALETFEPETVRSGYCSLRLSEAIHADGLRVALSGDAADELFAGYVPLEEAYGLGDAEGAGVREQCLATLSTTALQRIDRCGMRHQVEIREPFLDARVVAAAMACGRRELIRPELAGWVGKQPLRAIHAAAGLPAAGRDRPKTPLNEGAGFDRSQGDAPWVRYAEARISDAELKEGLRDFRDFGIATKEELLYLRLLASVMDVHRVPHLRSRPFIHMPAAAANARLDAFRVGGG